MNFSSTAERNRMITAVVIVSVLLVIGGYFISMMTPWLMGPQASTQARAVDRLMRVMMFIGGIVFLLVQGAVVWAVIFFRRRKGDDTDGPNVHGNYALEFIWTLIPTVVVFILTIYSYMVYVDMRAVQDNELEVNVMAQRYAFSFSYEDAATGEVINDNVIRTYVDRPVVLKMQASDVIHSMWIPAMRVKQDMLPGRDTELRFTPIEPGRYPVVCTELCGGGHGGMRAEILVYPSEESYLAWYEAELDCLVNPPADPAVAGRAILASGQYGCAGCHVLDDLGWQGQIGPSLNGIADRADSRAVAAGNASGEEYLHVSLWQSGDYLVPGYDNLMPVFESQMSIEDRDAITAYLLTQGSEPVELAPACDSPSFEEAMAAYEAEQQAVASR